MVAYGLGATDKFKGTGVYSGIQFEREKKQADDERKASDSGKSPKDAKKDAVDKAESP